MSCQSWSVSIPHGAVRSIGFFFFFFYIRLLNLCSPERVDVCICTFSLPAFSSYKATDESLLGLFLIYLFFFSKVIKISSILELCIINVYSLFRRFCSLVISRLFLFRVLGSRRRVFSKERRKKCNSIVTTRTQYR